MLSPGETTHSGIDDGWLLPAPEERVAVHTRSIGRSMSARLRTSMATSAFGSLRLRRLCSVL